MSWLSESQDRLPLTWWKGQPVYLAAILALVGVVSMVVTGLLVAASPSLLIKLIFTWSNLVDQYYVWTPLTYAFVNPPSSPGGTLLFVLMCFFFWRFGEQVERHLGRRVFVKLLAYLLLVPLVLLTLLAAIGLREWPAVGMGALEFAVFIAFATLYPRAQISLIIVSIDAWLMAVIFTAASLLSHLANHLWPEMVLLAGNVAFAFAYIRYQQGHWHVPTLASLKSRFRPEAPRERVSSRSSSNVGPRKGTVAGDGDSATKVDAILEKIHREGLQSLSEEERKIMERASEDLRKGG